jgi:arylsulfatase A-like enzyme
MALWLAAAKIIPWGAPEADWSGLGEWLADLAVITHQDLLFAFWTGLAFQGPLWLARRRPRLRRALFATLLGWAAACVTYAVVSVKIFAYLRSPLTYPLLYLAGDLRSMRSSVGAFISPAFTAALLLAPTSYLVAWWRLGERLPGWPAGRRRWAVLALFGVLVVDVAWGREAYAGRWADRAGHRIAESPHATLLISSVQSAIGLQPHALDIPIDPEDLAGFDLPVSLAKGGRRPLPGKPPRNVILLVLESTAARWLSVYGSRYSTTPNLQRETGHMLVFDAFYSHVGLTSNAMAAITLSLYPYMTWREYTVEYPRLPGRTLAEVFKAQGLRTAFLHTGDLEYVNQRGFLEGRGFDVLWDFRELGGAERLSSWGGEDRHLVDGLLRFIDQDRSRPFYAMAWTIQSHHPYDPSPDQPLVDFFGPELPPDDYDLGRYLNTILEVDRQLGRLFAGLRERKLADDTLVVITADHGEAFGSPHETWGHGGALYQENVQVPLLVWSPTLVKKGRHLATIGSHVDINPTVTDLLGLPADPSWHGRSMFDPGRAPRAYFYAAASDFLLGVRDGHFKYVYNLTTGSELLFDLPRDPEEQVDVSEQHPLLCKRLRQRVAAWREHERQHVARLLAGSPPTPRPKG